MSDHITALVLERKRTKRQRNHNAYHDFNKRKEVEAYKAGGYQEVVRTCGFVPDSTVRSWAKAEAEGKELASVGRPTFLSSADEALAMQVLRDLRKEDVAVDLDTVLDAGNKVQEMARWL